MTRGLFAGLATSEQSRQRKLAPHGVPKIKSEVAVDAAGGKFHAAAASHAGVLGRACSSLRNKDPLRPRLMDSATHPSIPPQTPHIHRQTRSIAAETKHRLRSATGRMEIERRTMRYTRS